VNSEIAAHPAGARNDGPLGEVTGQLRCSGKSDKSGKSGREELGKVKEGGSEPRRGRASGYRTGNRNLGIGKLGSLFCRIS
jgi:hypothetical protein